MPRRARLTIPNVPMHLIQRGNNRQPCFFGDEDYQYYLQWLRIHANNHGCQVHAYVLMSNHVHLLTSAAASESTGEMMKALGQRYVQYVNRRYQRSGTLWEGRFRSCLIQSEEYLLTCYRYVELNPVRAGMVKHPADYRWSSYLANAHGQFDTVIDPHAVYSALGNDRNEQQIAYRALFHDELEARAVHEIRRATRGNLAFGDNSFVAQIECALGRRAAVGQLGRPRK